MTNIASELVPLLLSEDGGTTWKMLVCLESYDAPTDSQITQTNTFCGIAAANGPIKFGPKGSAVCEANPTNSTMVTYNKLMQWQVANEVIMYKVEYPATGGSAGVNFYQSGNCTVSALDLKFATADVVKFDFTLTGQGVPIINAP